MRFQLNHGLTTAALVLFMILPAADGGIFFSSGMEDAAELGDATVRGGTFTEDGLKGNCFTGGGPDERIVIPLESPFPVNEGTFSLYLRLNESAAIDEGIPVFDVLGSGNWYDRFKLGIRPMNDGMLRIGVSIGETYRNRYGDRPFAGIGKLSDRQWHHIAFTWQNVNTARPDGHFKVYLDGLLIGELSRIEMTMENPAREIVLAGCSPSGKMNAHGPGGCISLDEITVYDHALNPSEIAKLAGVQTVDADFEDISLCPVYKLTGDGPRIDGEFNDSEWASTQTLGPLRNFREKTGTLADNQTRVNIAYGEDGKVYVGWQASGAPNPAGEAHDDRDAALWHEDSLELFFSPDGKTIVQFIGNAYGSTYDEMTVDGGENWNREWNGDWTYKASVGDGFWSGELVFDPASVGLGRVKAGDTWIFNACRNHFVPQKSISVWHKPIGGSFKNPDQMGRIRFHEQGLICSFIEIPEVVSGLNHKTMTWANPLKLRNKPIVNIHAFAFVDGAPSKVAAVSAIQLDAQNIAGKKTLEYSVEGEGLHKALLTICDLMDGEPVYRRPFYVVVKPPLYVEVTGNPCEGMLTAEIHARNIAGDIASGRLSLIDNSGKPAFVHVTGHERVQNVRFPITDVQPGDYTLSMTFVDSGGKTIAQRNIPLNVPAKPDCIHEDAGMKNYIDPWGPMKLYGQTVECWNRQYVFDNSLFPKKLISNGADVLAGEIAFHYTTADKHKGVLNNARLEVVESTPEMIVFKAWGGDDRISAEGTISVEYDGLIVYDLTLTPRERIDIADFRLVFPLETQSAKYILDGTAYGATQQKNVISHPGFKSTFGFKSIIGVVSRERGIYWFCESDEGWRPYDRPDVVSVSRNTQDVRLEFQIMRDVDFSRPLKLSCGFMGTPVKPTDFKLDRQCTYHYYPGGPLMAEDVEGCFQRFDLKKAAELGVKVVVPHEWWWKHYGGMEVANEESFKQFVKEAHDLGIKVILYRNAMAHPVELSQRYFGDTWLRYPITGFTKYAGKARPGADMGIVRCANSPEYLDWYVGGCRELVRKYDIDGFYYDFGFSACVNPKHGCGYVPEDGAGTKFRKGDTTSIIGVDVIEGDNVYSSRRPTYPILNHRKLWQRMFNMIKEEKGEEGFINAHTDGSAALHLAFVDTTFHSETAACRQLTGEFPTPQMYRIFYSKEIHGIPGEQIFRTNRHRPVSDAPKMLGISLLHREWFRPQSHGRWSRLDYNTYHWPSFVWQTLSNFDVDSAQWNPYWEKNNGPASAIRVSPWGEDAVLCSYWLKPTGLLAVVYNVSEKPVDAVITLGEPAAKFGTVTDTVSTEKKQTSPTMRMRLDGREFKLLRFE